MDSIELAPENGPASSAKLSLDISELVSRALSGAAIDMPTEGERLAQRYRELGMSGEMIGNAIARALGMVGTIRNVAERPAAAEATVAERHAEAPQAIDIAIGPAPLDGAALTVAANAELPESAAQITSSILLKSAGSDLEASEPLSEGESGPAPAPQPGPIPARWSRGPVAAVRRALFRQ